MSEEEQFRPKFNPQHLAKLKEGVEVWNKWYKQQRKINHTFVAHLENVDLSEAQLENVNLVGAYLKGADLFEAQLKNANFFQAHLEEATLIGAQLEDSTFSYAYLSDANMNRTNLKGADLSDACLKNIMLSYALLVNSNLRNTQFEEATLCDSNFENADFTDAQLKGADLTNSNLKNTNLSQADFENSVCNSAQFQNANLVDAHFENADLTDAQFTNADLSRSNLQDAIFTAADMKGVELFGANLTNAGFFNTNLQNANLEDANLENADFTYAKFENANLQDANLTNTKLAYTKNINFNDNKISGAIITSTTTAPWLTLKKSYTNTMMLFTLAAVFAFFIPYIVNITTWRSVNLAQELNSELEASLAIVATELETEGYPQAILVRKLSDGAENLTPCYAEDCKSWRIWQLLLGVRRGWLFAVLSIPIITYNFARVYLTREISILKDSEQATGLTPRWESIFWKVKIFNRRIPIWHQAGYQHHYRVHRIIWWLQWVALFAFIFHSVFWLGDIVQLPIKP